MQPFVFIRPLRAFRSGPTQLDTKRIYAAQRAFNQPDWQAQGKVFADGILLVTGDYDEVPVPLVPTPGGFRSTCGNYDLTPVYGQERDGSEDEWEVVDMDDNFVHSFNTLEEAIGHVRYGMGIDLIKEAWQWFACRDYQVNLKHTRPESLTITHRGIEFVFSLSDTNNGVGEFTFDYRKAGAPDALWHHGFDSLPADSTILQLTTFLTYQIIATVL